MDFWNRIKYLLQGEELPPCIDPAVYEQAADTVNRLFEEAVRANATLRRYVLPAATSLDGFQEIKESAGNFRVAGAYHCMARLRRTSNGEYTERKWFIQLAAHLLRHWRTPDAESLIALALRHAVIAHYDTVPVAEAILHTIEQYAAQNELTPALRDALEKFEQHSPFSQYTTIKQKRLFHNKLQHLLQGQNVGMSTPFLQQHELGRQLNRYLQGEPADQRNRWTEWLQTCETAGTKSKPAEKWLRQSRETLHPVPEDKQAAILLRVLEDTASYLQGLHKQENLSKYAPDWAPVPDWVSAFAWYAGANLSDHAEIRAAMEQVANLGSKKYPNVGALASKVGNACLRACTLMPGINGVSTLLRFKARAANRNVLNLIETLLDETARRQGISRQDIEDLGVDTFDLNARQEYIETLGEYSARLAICDQAQAVLEWRKPDGSPLKSAPAAVRENHKAALKRLQIRLKELQATLSAQTTRIENSYLEQRSWPYPQFMERFVQHPVLQTLAARLIWSFEQNGRSASAIWHDGQWRTPWGALPFAPGEGTTVHLWHPLGQELQQALDWRDWLQQHRITQPFKQAYREIYVVTPPELNTLSYSNRFAAHVLRQHQFTALCKQRGWQYHLQGAWDSHNTPRRDLLNWNYRVEFWVEASWDNALTSDAGIFLYVHTDQVRFYHRGELVNLPEVPSLLFSEIMRDVDLFVGVCSIGNDPEWQDSGDNRFQAYWNRYAFEDELSVSGEMRKAALERLIPRLKIADKCRFEGKFLYVQGTRHTYKIHCGSGNILMSPHNQYLCIVPGASSGAGDQKLYLPFEGDRMLSIIISKALLLANDDKITDRTILRQL